MPQFFDQDGNGYDYATSRQDPNTGENVYYDADGNEIARQTANPGTNRAETQFRNVDPETGQVYYSADSKRGPGFLRRGGKRADRRDARREERARQNAQMAAQQGFYGGAFAEGMGGVSGAFEGLEGELPSELDLLGGQENIESEVGGAQADAGAIAAQRAALEQLGVMAQGGYTAEEAAAMQRMRSETAQQEKSQRDAVMQQMAMRGMSGSGAELAQQLAAQQGGANRGNQMTLETQAQAQRRALQALGMQSDAASGMRGQSFQEDTTRRGAVDDFNRWNAERRGSAAQQRYANRFGLAGAQSDASGRTAELAGARRKEVEEQQNRSDDKRTDRTSKIIGSII